MHRDQLPIHEPCHADWEGMTGGQTRRFCGSCTKHVHDLSAMTATEADRLLKAEQSPCVRYAVGPDGRILHAAARPARPARPVRLPRLLAIGAALLGAGPAFASGAVAQPEGEPARPGLLERVLQMAREAVGQIPETVISEGPVVMGEVAPVEPPPPAAPPPPPAPPAAPPPPVEPPMIMGKVSRPLVFELPRGEVFPEVERSATIPEVEAAPRRALIPEVEEGR